MARLPSFKRIITDTLEKYEDLQQPVFSVLNSFMENVNRVLNNRLTISDNFDGEILTFQDNGTYPLKLAWNRTSSPRAIWIGQIARVDGASVSLPSAVTLNWSFNQSSQIEIAEVTGLSASPSDTYQITIIAITG